LNVQGEADPGQVAIWKIAINYPTQIFDVGEVLGTGTKPQDPLLLGNHSTNLVYYAKWDRETKKFSLVRWYGSFRGFSSVNISQNGWVYIDGYWWKWEDEAVSPPRFANIARARGQGAFHKGYFSALATRKNKGGITVALIAKPAPGRYSAKAWPSWRLPFVKSAGYDVWIKNGQPIKAFAVDAEGKNVWTAKINKRAFRPVKKSWSRLTLPVSLRAPGDLRVTATGDLFLVDGSGIYHFKNVKGRYKKAWYLSEWGGSSKERFGKNIRMTHDGLALVVADTERHRLLWFNSKTKTFLAQLGETDTPGDDPFHVNRPDEVSLAGSRLVVADEENQRVLKCELRP